MRQLLQDSPVGGPDGCSTPRLVPNASAPTRQGGPAAPVRARAPLGDSLPFSPSQELVPSLQGPNTCTAAKAAGRRSTPTTRAATPPAATTARASLSGARSLGARSFVRTRRIASCSGPVVGPGRPPSFRTCAAAPSHRIGPVRTRASSGRPLPVPCEIRFCNSATAGPEAPTLPAPRQEPSAPSSCSGFHQNYVYYVAD